MLSRNELWSELEPLVAARGLQLFDLDMPNRQSGVVRVFITRPPGAAGGGVTVDECAEVSRCISAHPELSALLAEYALEVSSPGINRRLQRAEHFAGAIGERVQITARAGPYCGQAVTGRLAAFDGGEVVLEVEGSGVEARFGLSEIAKARVDFLFAKQR